MTQDEVLAIALKIAADIQTAHRDGCGPPYISHPLRILMSGMVINDSECMLWSGANSGNGYGRIYVDGKTRATHILSYELFVGPVPKGKVLDHTCRNRACFNPGHLDPKTSRENTLIGEGPTAKNARKTHCLRGHELLGSNLITRVRNGYTSRECRQCKKDRRRRCIARKNR